MSEYLKLLKRVDAWWRNVRRSHPEQVPCAVGCRDCCLGLFDINAADADLLREGMRTLDPDTRRDIEERSAAIVSRVGASIEGKTDDEIDAIIESEGAIECPVLGTKGECRLYEYRPLTCRLMGAPVVDRDGEAIFPEGCSKCTLSAADAPRLDYYGLRAGEGQVLGKRTETQFIAQALGNTNQSG